MDASTTLSWLKKTAKAHLRDYSHHDALMAGPFGKLYETVKADPAQNEAVRDVFAYYVHNLTPSTGSFKHENFWRFYGEVKSEPTLFSVFTPEIITRFAKGLMDRGFVSSLETLRNHTLGQPKHTAAVDKAAAGFVLISRYDAAADDNTPVLTLAFNKGADADYSSILCQRGYRAGVLKGLMKSLRRGNETWLQDDLASILHEAAKKEEGTAFQARHALRILEPILAS